MKVAVVGNNGSLQSEIVTHIGDDWVVSEFTISQLKQNMDNWDAIIYLGGETQNSDKFLLENYQNVANLISLSNKINARFIYLSSIAAFYYKDYQAYKNSKYVQYAYSKYLARNVCLNNSADYCILHLSSINHPRRISSIHQKFTSLSPLMQNLLWVIGFSYDYCERVDILYGVEKALNTQGNQEIIVSRTFESKLPNLLAVINLLNPLMYIILRRKFDSLIYLSQGSVKRKNLPFGFVAK